MSELDYTLEELNNLEDWIAQALKADEAHCNEIEEGGEKFYRLEAIDHKGQAFYIYDTKTDPRDICCLFSTMLH